MKKKIVMLLLCSVLLSFTACASKEKTPESTTTTESTKSNKSNKQEKEVAPIKDLPDGSYTDMGAGNMYLSCAGGTSENGNVPVIFIEDEILVQIGLNAFEFDGSKLSYVYLDGMLITKEQLANTQTSIELADEALSVGIHKVEVVQYDSEDDSGNMVTYKTASYEIKSK